MNDLTTYITKRRAHRLYMKLPDGEPDFTVTKGGNPAHYYSTARLGIPANEGISEQAIRNGGEAEAAAWRVAERHRQEQLPDRLRRERAERERQAKVREKAKRAAAVALRRERAAQTAPGCPYKTIKEALAHGWEKVTSGDQDGEMLLIKGHRLRRRAPEERYVYKSTVSKVYGLPPKMIEEIGEPDKYCDNPHDPSGPPASLYRVKRVEAWIDANKERVEKAREHRAKRSEAARRVQEEKRSARLREDEQWARTVPITVQPFPPTLLDDARGAKRFSGKVDWSEEKGLHAHVRHALTNYESLLREMCSRADSDRLYPLLRERVDAAVKAAVIGWKQQGNHGQRRSA
jgi:hypothetical protein